MIIEIDTDDILEVINDVVLTYKGRIRQLQGQHNLWERKDELRHTRVQLGVLERAFYESDEIKEALRKAHIQVHDYE